MRKALAISAAAGAILILPSVSAGSRVSTNTYKLRASMNTQQVVTPKNRRWRAPASVRNAHGSFAGTMTASGSRRTLRWRITFAGVGASQPRIADIHYGKPGHFGAFLVRLCQSCKSGQRGTKKVNAAGARAIQTGSTWITIITPKHPNGVIRGQIKAS